MVRRSWYCFFDRKARAKRIVIIWETLARAFKAAYTYAAQIGTALGTVIRASVRYTYSILVKQFAGNRVGAKAQAAYTGIAATLKGRTYGLTARAVYMGAAASLKGRPYGLLAKMSYSGQVKVGAQLGTSVRASYSGTLATLKGRPTGFSIQARYNAATKQTATSGTKFSISASYSASAAAQANPPWLPKFDLSADKDSVNTFPGASYNITFVVTNVGGLTAKAKVSIWDVGGTLKGRFTVELAPGASYSETLRFVAPQEPGTYYIESQVENLFTGRIDDSVAVKVVVVPAQ